MAFLFFFAGALGAFLLASAAAALAGSAALLPLLCGLSVVATLLLSAGLGVGALVFKRLPRGMRAFALGVASATAFIGVLVVASLLAANPAQSWPLLLLLPLLGGLAPLAVPQG